MKFPIDACASPSEKYPARGCDQYQKVLTSTKHFDNAKTKQQELVGQLREKNVFSLTLQLYTKILEDIMVTVSLHWATKQNSTAQV